MQRVVFHHAATPWLRQRLGELRRAGLAVEVASPEHEEDLARCLGEAQILWHVLAPATAELIAAAPQLRLIQKIGVGVNTIDLEAARGRGIAVCNMPGTNTPAVAELTLLLMLACLRRVRELDRLTRAGSGWPLPEDLVDGLGELCGATVGLLGYGAVPARLAPVLQALGARTIYWSRRPKPDAAAAYGSLEEVLSQSDVLSLHLPLVAETTGLLDRGAFARMKPGAILVNTARGGLVDETALVAALRSGSLRAAGLDVFAEEPLAGDHPLLTFENVVLTPHIAWQTTATLDRSLDVAVENCRRLHAGEDLLYRVV
jgi:phosphoglycerate dehydrogenase-like enzyme